MVARFLLEVGTRPRAETGKQAQHAAELCAGCFSAAVDATISGATEQQYKHESESIWTTKPTAR